MPFGHTILYPFTLFTTWVHEMGHGITALLAGGTFIDLEINSNAGGLAHAYAEGWRHGLVAAGGLLAPPLLGAVLLATVHGPRRARIVLVGLVLAIAFTLVVYVRSAAGWVALPIVAAALVFAAAGFRAAPHRRVWVVQFLAVILSVDTLTRMVSYAFASEARRGQRSDVGLMADYLGGHYMLWGLVITAIALGALALGAWIAIRRSTPKSP